MNKPKHIPMRTCIATKVKKPKRELMRIVQDPESEKLVIDLKGKIRARGANLDATEEAFDLMVKKNALPRALKLERKITPEEYAELREQFLKSVEERNFRPDNKPVKIRVKKEEVEKKLKE